jgi:hypothetical protein
MKKATLLSLLAFGALVESSATSSATQLLSGIGPLPTESSYSTSFISSGGSAALSFNLLGFTSLDGNNGNMDLFTLSLNGASILSGTYNLGGGGGNLTTTNVFGLILDGLNTDPAYQGPQDASISISGFINLLAGTNTLTFAYASPNGFQGMRDEAWGVNNVNVAGASPVPIPPAFLLLGSGLLGLGRVRRKAEV